MSFIEDDSINGSVIESTSDGDYKPRPSSSLRNRLIEYGIDHKEFKTNIKNITKYLTNCKYILDNMKVWEKINFPKHIAYKISGEKNWI